MQQADLHAPHFRRRLTRSSTERRWAGVAGGMAEYFDIDPTLMRIIWIVAAIASGGLALIVYFALALVMPRDEEVGEETSPASTLTAEEYAERRRRFAGIVLIILGGLFLVGQMGALRWVEWAVVWPLLIVGLGVFLLVRGTGAS